MLRGNDAEAIENFQIAEGLYSSGDQARGGPIARIAYGYSQIGLHDDALRLLDTLEAFGSSGKRIGPAQSALTYLAAGDYEKSLEWFNTTIETRDTPTGGVFITVLVIQNVYSDPVLEQLEFVEVRNRLGFR
jgi:hypothetical protein